jgi:hypothetical protein
MDKSMEGDKVVLRGRGIGRWEKGFYIHKRGEIDKVDTAWVSGGSGAFRRLMWNTLGGMDPIYNPFYWEDIDPEIKANFSGIFSNCLDSKRQVIGSKFPEPIFDGSFIDIFYKYNVKGDKWGFFRTEILKQFPFPVIAGEKFLSEALVWNRVALQFKTRFINEGLSLVEYQPDGLSSRSLLLRIKNPQGAILYYREFLDLPLALYWKLRNLLNYLRFSFHGRTKIFQQIISLKNYFLIFCSLLLLPVAYFIYKNDRRHVKSL